MDLNRNFDFQWSTGGSSDEICSDLYAGLYPNSEPETRALQIAIKNLQNRWDAYMYHFVHIIFFIIRILQFL